MEAPVNNSCNYGIGTMQGSFIRGGGGMLTCLCGNTCLKEMNTLLVYVDTLDVGRHT